MLSSRKVSGHRGQCEWREAGHVMKPTVVASQRHQERGLFVIIKRIRHTYFIRHTFCTTTKVVSPRGSVEDIYRLNWVTTWIQKKRGASPDARSTR